MFHIPEDRYAQNGRFAGIRRHIRVIVRPADTYGENRMIPVVDQIVFDDNLLFRQRCADFRFGSAVIVRESDFKGVAVAENIVRYRHIADIAGEEVETSRDPEDGIGSIYGAVSVLHKGIVFHGNMLTQQVVAPAGNKESGTEIAVNDVVREGDMGQITSPAFHTERKTRSAVPVYDVMLKPDIGQGSEPCVGIEPLPVTVVDIVVMHGAADAVFLDVDAFLVAFVHMIVRHFKIRCSGNADGFMRRFARFLPSGGDHIPCGGFPHGVSENPEAAESVFLFRERACIPYRNSAGKGIFYIAVGNFDPVGIEDADSFAVGILETEVPDDNVRGAVDRENSVFMGKMRRIAVVAVTVENSQFGSVRGNGDALFAGKFTTAREYHSGEGIFFTSHLMDDFFIVSDELLFTRNNFSDAYTNMASCEKGTLVYMQLFNKSQKTVKEVFDRYTNPEEGFTHTSVPIAHMFTGGSPVSRSEARRLGGMLLRFKKATLDFTGVKGIGQAFTHELFVVWQKRNPEIELNCIGMAEDVERMIRRVLVDAGEQT